MEPSNTPNVQYDRWNEDNINMDVDASQSTMTRLYNRMCVGSTGIAMKTVGALVALVFIYILGYTTGYYAHRCS
uniref:Small integral membrane protein 1 n=1 Tax=Cynoglossus semilaevis TaxID=244447 RepID=A0A3P8UWR1_CYNSE